MRRCPEQVERYADQAYQYRQHQDRGHGPGADPGMMQSFHRPGQDQSEQYRQRNGDEHRVAEIQQRTHRQHRQYAHRNRGAFRRWIVAYECRCVRRVLFHVHVSPTYCSI